MQIDPHTITAVDLSYPLGQSIPALVQIEGVIFLFNGLEAEDDHLIPNYVLLTEHPNFSKHMGEYFSHFHDGAVELPLRYVQSVRAIGHAPPATIATYKSLKFLNTNYVGGETRWTAVTE